MAELEQLLEQIGSLDFSDQNPLMHKVIEQEIEGWIDSYESKKSMPIHVLCCIIEA